MEAVQNDPNGALSQRPNTASTLSVWESPALVASKDIGMKTLTKIACAGALSLSASMANAQQSLRDVTYVTEGLIAVGTVTRPHIARWGGLKSPKRRRLAPCCAKLPT